MGRNVLSDKDGINTYVWPNLFGSVVLGSSVGRNVLSDKDGINTYVWPN